jgi:hypothetical protein
MKLCRLTNPIMIFVDPKKKLAEDRVGRTNDSVVVAANRWQVIDR